MADTAKMRHSVKSAFQEFNGRGEGLSVCVITERMDPEKPNWFGFLGGFSYLEGLFKKSSNSDIKLRGVLNAFISFVLILHYVVSKVSRF